ncbi:MAG: capsid protein [Cressdnaviricota sp.]|nr:MAG: capsid protein [Cressdnaviricota sp.]
MVFRFFMITFVFALLVSYMAYYRSSYGRRSAPFSRRFRAPSRTVYVRSAPKRRAAPRRRAVRSTRRRSAVSTSCSCTEDLSAGQKFLLAQIDPFEPKALGCKVPDSNTIPSVSCMMNDLRNITQVIAGNASCVALLPTVTGGIVTANEFSATDWSWPTSFGGKTNFSKRADYVNTYELDRPVAHGIRISCPLAPTSVTGFVHVAVATESFNNSSSWPFPTNADGMAGYPFYKRFSLAALTQSPLTVINKYVDETAFRYTGADSENIGNAGIMEFHVPRSWGALLIAVTGAPPGAGSIPLSYEVILHLEGIPKSTGVLAGSTAAPLNNTILGATAHMVANTDFSHTEEQQESYMNRALSAASQGLGQASRVTFERFVLPGIRAGAYNLAGAAFSAGVSRGISGVNSNPLRLSVG